MLSLIGSQLRAFLLLGVLLSCGLGAVLIQTVGWLTMIPTQLVKTGSVTEAVENTFSGEHPCEFCKAAESLREVEQPAPLEPEPTRSVTKQWGKDLLSSTLKAIVVTRPEAKFLPHDREARHRFASIILDLESPPPQRS